MIAASDAVGMMWEVIGPYVGHKSGCTYDSHGSQDDTDYCTCGLAKAKERLRDIRKRIMEEENAGSKR